MRSITIVAVAVAASLIGCQREPSSPKPANQTRDVRKPFLVKINADIEHEFYRDISYEAFLELLPTGSVDSVDIDVGKTPQVFCLVKVPDVPGREKRVLFETTFKTADGKVIDKRWTAAKDRKSGKATAVFSLPRSVVEAETKAVPLRDGN